MSAAKDLFARSIIENYHRYLVPLLFEDYARDLVRHIPMPSGGRILELASGTGVMTRHLKAALPDNATLVATDINPAMVEASRRHAESTGGGVVKFKEADGTSLPFADNVFDAVACQFGVMFYPDREQGYREAARVLKREGTLAFNVWDSLEQNPLVQVVHETVVALHPEDPPAFMALPFGYYDQTTITDELRQAGFDNIEVTAQPGISRAPSARDATMGAVAGSPLASQLAERGIQETALEAVEQALVTAFGSGELAVPMQSITVVARR